MRATIKRSGINSLTEHGVAECLYLSEAGRVGKAEIETRRLGRQIQDAKRRGKVLNLRAKEEKQ